MREDQLSKVVTHSRHHGVGLLNHHTKKPPPQTTPPPHHSGVPGLLRQPHGGAGAFHPRTLLRQPGGWMVIKVS